MSRGRDRALPGASTTRLGALALACLATMGLAACSGSYPTSPDVVHVTMVDYRFSAPAQISVGRVVFNVVNHGQHQHELVLVPLPQDFPPLNQQLHSGTRRALPTIAVLPAMQPGSGGTFAVDLAAGRYGIISFVEGDNGNIDALRGMNAEIRAQ